MNLYQSGRPAGRWFLCGAVLGLGVYATYVGVTWLRYGTQKRRTRHEEDHLLDRFLPDFEVSDCQAAYVVAPEETALAAALDCDLADSSIARAIFRGREIILGSETGPVLPRQGLLEQMTALGWGILAENPGREIVLGAVTKPWEANVVFRPIPPGEFAHFHEPGYAKIAWTLRADPIGIACSVVRTETRVATTDPVSRSRFRNYWAFLSPGILIIRFAMLRLVKRQAESRVRDYLGLRASLLRAEGK
jgi:hypothetical protein